MKPDSVPIENWGTLFRNIPSIIDFQEFKAMWAWNPWVFPHSPQHTILFQMWRSCCVKRCHIVTSEPNDLWGGSQDESKGWTVGSGDWKETTQFEHTLLVIGRPHMDTQLLEVSFHIPAFVSPKKPQLNIFLLHCAFFWKYKQKGLFCLLFGLTVTMKGLQHMVCVLKRFCLVGWFQFWFGFLFWFGMVCLVLVLKKRRKIKQCYSVLINPQPHTLNSLYLCSEVQSTLYPWALSHQPSSDCFHHCHKPSTKSQRPSRRMLKMKNLEALAIRVDPDFLLHVNTFENICAYILSSTFVITKHCVPFGLGLFCFDRLFAVLRGSGICMIKFSNWEPAFSHPHANNLPLYVFVENCSLWETSLQCGLHVSEWMLRITLGRSYCFLRSGVW